MTINKFLTIRFCLLSVASAICLSSCSQSEPELAHQDVTTSDEWRPGLTYTADVDAIVDDSPIEPISSDEARGLYDASSNTETHEGLPFTLKNKEYAAGSEKHTHILPIVDFDRTQDRKHVLKSVLVLYDKTNNDKVLANANWSVRFLKNKTAGKPDTTKLTLTDVTLPAGKTLNKDHTWYMMSFLGGVEISGNTVSVKLNRLLKNDRKLGEYYPDMYLNEVNADQRVPMLVPFATSWRQVQVDGTKITPTVASGQKRTDHLIFKPQAAFIELGVENYMSFAVGLSSELRMESNCLTTEGGYDFSALNSGDFSGLIPTMEAKSYWKPSGTKKDRVNDEWVEHNGVHYVNTFKFSKRITSLAARQDSRPSKYSGRYIIAVMPFDPQKAPLEPSQKFNLSLAYPQTLFFGEPKIVGRTPSNPTTNPNSYQSDPKYLVPAFGNRYLLGSTGETFYKQKSYAMTLRVIRPMLPIEHIYLHKGDNPAYKATRSIAEAMPANRMNQSFKDKYRLPYWSEIGPILTLNYKTLTEGQVVGGLVPQAGKVVNWGRGYGRVSSIVASPQVVIIQDKPFDMIHYYNWNDGDRAGNQKRIYGLTYIDPNIRRMNYITKEGGYKTPENDRGNSWNRTNMYKCATRIIYSQDGQMVRIATYYLGPNLDINNQFYYTMHDSFWTSIADPSGAVITRELPFNGNNEDFTWYWGDGSPKPDYYKNRKRIPIKRSGETGTGDDKEEGEPWTVYWLKERSW